jgi:proline-specific peptidase
MSHDYLQPLEAIAGTGRRVIFYDQLGSGHSDHPHNPDMWNVGLFVEEARAIRKSLGLGEVHLLGQSWGGFLAQECMLTDPTGVKSLILANSAASTRQWIAEAQRLRAELPLELQQTLNRHEAAGTTEDPAYVSATDVYYRRHLCRLDPWPDCLNRTLEKLGNDPEVYNSMWGPSEFHCTGTLQHWDVEQRIGKIGAQTLILSGRYDESTPAINAVLHHEIKNSEWVIFEESSHTPHLEETGKYLQVLTEFLLRAESK